MLDIKSFLDKQAKGLARVLETTTENIIVAYKQFDLTQAALGVIVELPEQVTIQPIKELNDQVTSLQSQISDINTFLAQKPS